MLSLKLFFHYKQNLAIYSRIKKINNKQKMSVQNRKLQDIVLDVHIFFTQNFLFSTICEFFKKEYLVKNRRCGVMLKINLLGNRIIYFIDKYKVINNVVQTYNSCTDNTLNNMKYYHPLSL